MNAPLRPPLSEPLTNHWSDSPAWQALRAAPHAHDLFHLLRWLDVRADAPAPLGRAARPQDEPIRLGQRASLSFAPSMVAGLTERDGAPPSLSIYGFGLFGPNGPLPLHLTEYARERERIADDPTLAAFADLFHHRLILLFYRAWADAQATVSLDRPGRGRFDEYVASLLGLPPQDQPDEVGRHARYYQAGHLARQARNPEGLQQILQRYFEVPVRVVEHVVRWVTLEADECLALGSSMARLNMGLGVGSTLGIAVRDAQSHFRLVLGPMPLATYRRFLPGGDNVPALLRWVGDYVGLELGWDVQLLLSADEVPAGALSAPQPLGLGAWLGQRPSREAAGDLIIDYQAVAKRAAAMQSTPSRQTSRLTPREAHV
ncbi:type VI secretion system baseplate subunit TssG [Andreprevotia chitinilytica]|uniref:type VI secretion system baseplate subunit TssG n=1 Tax=Andreprevotia chitinilytica TaxID=396808 RepID=UPI000A07A260|nr:type VI secretion system baseplate subunit TssG [Andreprevotia chitinilytica]